MDIPAHFRDPINIFKPEWIQAEIISQIIDELINTII